MAFAEDLLDQAQHLARREKNRPKQASLRRAVSTAYYALFHLLIAEASRNWRWPAHRHSFARAFEHGRMKTACDRQRAVLEAYFKTKPGENPRLLAARHLHVVADTFVEMQQQRHIADYDNSIRWSRKETLIRVDSVAAAFESWKAVRKDATAQQYLLSLFVNDR